MNNIYKKIEDIYAKDQQSQPLWAKEILSELREIKTLLKDLQNPRRNKRENKDYYDFVKEFRKKLSPDTAKDIYPEVIYQDRRIGANFKGHLYDKATTNVLPSHEAFAVYEYFYNKREKIDEFIRV